MLFHLKDKPFQVFTFGMIYAYRMVGGLCELMEDAHPAAGLGRSSKYSQTELLAAHCLRATECKENTTRSNLFESAGIEPAVAALRKAERCLANAGGSSTIRS